MRLLAGLLVAVAMVNTALYLAWAISRGLG